MEGWPGQNLDLNSIKNVWGIMKRKISVKNPTMIDEVKKICKRVWLKLTPEYLLNLYASMPQRMALCIAAGGGLTKYLVVCFQKCFIHFV